MSKNTTKRYSKLLWQSISLLGMLLAPALLLYPGVKIQSNFLKILGYFVLIFSMLIPLRLK